MAEAGSGGNGQPRILIADDKPSMRQLLQATFAERGYSVAAAANGDEAVRLLQQQPFDLVITDYQMPGRNGIAVLRAAKAISADIEVILVTAYGTVEIAVEAMRLGARDFIAKPFKLAEIELKVDKILQEKRENERDAVAPREVLFTRPLVGESGQTKQLIKMVKKIAPSRSSVLITGPTGTGKELVARAIHDASERRDRPFVALNCAALAPGVLESELFGHEKGAFTGATARREGRFERAHTGTLFLDEVGEIDTGIQTKLLRAIEEGELERVGGTQTIKVDVRIVAATNRDLREAIEKGQFREDFYYRLNVFSLRVAPLRERRDDIPALIDFFLKRFSAATGKRVTDVADDVMDVFMRYPWPGNVRELENVLERAVVLAEAETIAQNDLPPEILFTQEEPSPDSAAPENASLIERTDNLESELIRTALEQFHWNKTRAADHLGLKRTTLQYKIKKYGLE